VVSLEGLRLDPAIGIARWLRDVSDSQMDRLRNPDQGPFVACCDRHLLPPALPLLEVLEGGGGVQVHGRLVVMPDSRLAAQG